MVGEFEGGCDYMIPAGKEPYREHSIPIRCGERVAQVSTAWESGYGGTSICHRCVNHQAEIREPQVN
jgi:hypothetical protein